MCNHNLCFYKFRIFCVPIVRPWVTLITDELQRILPARKIYLGWQPNKSYADWSCQELFLEDYTFISFIGEPGGANAILIRLKTDPMRIKAFWEIEDEFLACC